MCELSHVPDKLLARLTECTNSLVEMIKQSIQLKLYNQST